MPPTTLHPISLKVKTTNYIQFCYTPSAYTISLSSVHSLYSISSIANEDPNCYYFSLAIQLATPSKVHLLLPITNLKHFRI